MKNLSIYAYMSMMLMSTDSLAYGGRGKVSGTNYQPIIEPKTLKPFKEQDGIANMITEYKLIKQGKSNKGKRKQAIVIDKINKFLELGSLIIDDLN